MSNHNVACSGAESVERHDDEHAVAGGRVELAVGDQRLVVDGVEGDVAQLLEGGMGAANLVQPRDEWLQRSSGRRAPAKSRGRSSYFSESRYSSLPSATAWCSNSS